MVRDVDGIAHVQARNEHDLFFLQGYLLARDRLFQMDVNRRTADGTLAELLGPGAPGYDALGSGFAGTPFVIVGHNAFIAWGPTTNPLDVTDVYLEQRVPDPTSPSGLSTLFQGQPEHVIPIPQQWFANVIGDSVPDNLVPAAQDVTLIVPRRNHGPIVQALPGGQALSVQFTGFSATRELETF